MTIKHLCCIDLSGPLSPHHYANALVFSNKYLCKNLERYPMSKILLLLDRSEDRDFFTQTLSNQYEFIFAESAIESQINFDLCILTKAMLDRLKSPILDRKQKEAPIFLPFLLLISRQQLKQITPEQTKFIDEFLLHPVEKIELQTRVRLLLDMRRWSMETEKWFRTTLYSIGDGVITTDISGRVRQMNAMAEKLTGWSEMEAKEKPLLQIFNIINEITRHKVAIPIEEILNKGKVIGLNNQNVLIARDGSEHPIADNIAPIYSTGGKIIGSVVVFRDRTTEQKAQAEIQKTRLLAETIVNTLNEALLVLDSKRQVLSANEAFYKIFKITDTESEVIGKSIFQINKGLFNFSELRKLMAEISSETIAKDHFTIKHNFKQLGNRIISFNIRKVHNKESQMDLLLLAMEDITDKIKFEEALRESEEKYRLIVENAYDGIEITQNDRIMFCNTRFAKMLGYTREELKNIPFNKVFSEKGLEELYARHRLREKGEPVPKHFETTLKKKDGSVINVEISYEIINYQGKPATFAIIRDITGKKRAQLERERLITAIEQAGEIVVITDPDGRIQYVNPAFQKITGFVKEEVLGQNPRILKSGKHDKAFYERLWSTINKGEIWQGRIINKRKDGELFTEDLTISPVKDAQGNIINFVSVGRDVTQQLILEQQFLQAQKMESVGRLAGGVAHDYNNMLTVILGNAQLGMSKLEEGNLFYDYFSKIHAAASRSAEITKQLLGFARKQTIEPKVLDLNITIKNMLKMLRRLIGEDIDLVWLPQANLWNVKMDPSQIDQILMNLVVNARDAIRGIGKITIEAENKVLDEMYCKGHAGFKPGEFVRLTISDNGCGIEKEILNKIFEPFFTTKEKEKGTGLGLATVYGIVKQNNGFINVYSEIGKGTSFRIYLPKYEGDERVVQNLPQKEIPAGRGESILIIEDDPAILEFSQNLLKELGYRVQATTNAKQALQLVRKSKDKFDLVLTDIIMPEMSGKEVAKRIQKMISSIKILFMSGYTANAIAHHGVLDEGVNYIQKPFSVHDLALKVRQILDEVEPSDSKI